MNERVHIKTPATPAVAASTLLGMSLAALSAAPALALAAPAPAPAADAAPVAAQVQAADGASLQAAACAVQVKVANVAGSFSFRQDLVTPTVQIARNLGGANKVLCSGSSDVATSDEAVVEDALDWQITVDGDGVQNAFAATLGELAESGSQSTVMGCTCLGNPADGRATANAGCTGVRVNAILDLAGVADEANTITFVSADGYEVALPLSYVRQRTALVVYQVNGEPLSQSVGGTNQVWLGATAARYFASDVVEIRVTCEAEPPAAPGTPEADDADAYANRPNVGVLEGQSA